MPSFLRELETDSSGGGLTGWTQVGTSSEVTGWGQRSGRCIGGCNVSAFFQDGIREHEDTELGWRLSATHPPKRQNDRPTGQQFKDKSDTVVLTLPPTAGEELLTGASGGQTQGDVAEMPAT